MGGQLDRTRRSAAVVAGMLLLASCSPGPGADGTPGRRGGVTGTSSATIDVSSLQGRITFAAGGLDLGSTEVYVMEANGSGLTRLTDNVAADFDPAWSPDGSRVVFRSQRDGNDEIYVMQADGSDPRNISDHPAVDWGRTGRPTVVDRLQLRPPRGRTAPGFLTDPDGEEVRDLDEMFFESPAWSPDGRRIAFMHETFDRPGGNYDIYVINADGTGVRQLTESPADHGWPAWSPDGSRIVFSSIRDDCLYSDADDCLTTGDIGPFHTLYVMDPDGSNESRLSNVFGQFAVWAPDGRYIGFTPGPVPGGIYVMSPDGSGVTQIPTDGVPGMPEIPDWID